MKKFAALLLVLAMALSLCTTAFAGSAAETAVLRLTGDAADEVVNLKDGQRVSAGKDVAVRLNVQNDPGAAEYTVTLDGEAVEADHSTAQYHFYYLPAAQLSGVSTLSVSTQADVGADAVSIATAEELKAFRDRVNNGETTLNAVLTADIALDKSETWTPIGTSSAMYAGIFDGNGHTISGLNVTGANNGLFKMTGAATIQNLTISDSTIGDSSNSNLLGAFVGRIKDSTTLINCHTTDTVTVSGGAVGGLVGGTDTPNAAFTLTMERCSNAAAVSGYAASAQMGVGGLVGVLRNGATIKDCFNTGAVTNKSTSDSAAVGGLVGSVYNNSNLKTPLTLTDVYNTGSITAASSGTKNAGGLVGNSTWGFNITNAYGTMTVKAGDAYGGIIVGTVQNDVTVENVYVELIRGMNGNCKVSHNESSNKKMSAVTDQHKMFNDTEMKAPDKLLAKLGETFAEDTANINNGYPVLAWQNAAPESAAQLTVSVGGVEVPVTLPADGSTDAAKPTEVAVEFENPGENAVMDRIYFTDLAEGVSLGTTMSNTGVLSNELTWLDAGYTGEQLFFHKTPKAIAGKTVKAVWTDGEGAKRYYTINVTRAAQSGLALGPSSTSVYDANPREAGASNGYNADGFLKTMAAMFMGVKTSYAAQAVYMDGTLQRQGGADISALPAWDDLKEKSNGLYYYEEGSGAYAPDYAYFARVGRYWLPVTYTSDAGTAAGFVPVQARLGTSANVDYYIGKAQAVDMTSIPAEAQNMLTTAINTIESKKSQFNNSGLTQNESGAYEEVSYSSYSGIFYRDYFGYKPYAEALYEKEINMMMDLTAIFTTWGENADLAAQQLEAYQKIMNMQGGIHRFIDIQSLSDRDAYQNIRQAKWDVIHAADLTAINAILTGLKLETITPAEPEVMLGDINGDGQITLKDATLLLQHVNEIITLTAEQLAAADINGDGQITLKDATLLLQFVNEIIPALPAGKVN